MKNNYLTILSIILIVSTLLQSSFVIIKVLEARQIPVSGKVVDSKIGYIGMCINNPPVVDIGNCPSRVREGIRLTCHLNSSDVNDDNVSFIPFSNDFLTVKSDGEVNFKTFRDDIYDYKHLLGNHTIEIFGDDNSECSNNLASVNYSVEIYDVNDPPVLRRNLPDRTIPDNIRVLLFRLNDYFFDPEGETLIFNNTDTSQIVITILSSSDVLAYSTSCSASEYVTFSAKDPKNLSTSSNRVLVKVNCDTGDDGEQVDGSGTKGGSGSGGGIPPAPCISNWKCDPWSECSPEGVKSKKCFDQNACDPNNYVYWVYDECVYIPMPDCVELWECTDWSECQPNNLMTRSCVDLNKCEHSESKPEEVMKCEYIPTCTDGIQNQGETGVDCGGPCLPCVNLEIPGLIREQRNLISNIILLSSSALMSVLIIYKYFHKEINTAMAKVFFGLVKKKKKRIFLNSNQKILLLEKILKLEKSIKDKNLKEKTVEGSTIGREFVSLALKIPLSFNKEILNIGIKNNNVKEPLSLVLQSLYKKIVDFETKKQGFFKLELLIFLEELRELVHETSMFSHEDIRKEIKEMSIDNDDDYVAIKKMMLNNYIAMQFEKVDIVKNKYVEIMTKYDSLPEKDKNWFYDDIFRLFNEIKYFLSINK